MPVKIAIIGGGVVGSTAAFYLSKNPEFAVTLFDESIGQATSASAGIINPWLSKRRNKEWYEMVKLGAAFYPDFLKAVLGAKEIPKEVYQKVGTILFTKKEKQLEELLEIGLKRRVDAPEIGELKILSPKEIQALIPVYSKSKKALFASGGARVDGKELVHVLQKAAQANGASFVNEYASLKHGKNGRWFVQSPSVQQEFDYVLLANSAWLPQTLAPFGYDVDVRPQKGQLVELQTDWQTDDWPVVMPVGEKDIIPFLNGKISIGATHEDEEGFNLTLEQTVLREMVMNANTHFSDALNVDSIVGGRVGTRAYTSDYAPFFGEVPGMQNVYTASGMGSTGLTAGPLLGKILSDFILGNQPTLNPENYPIQKYISKK